MNALEPDYTVAVYYNGEVRKLSYNPSALPNSEVRLYIHCKLWEKSSGMNKVFVNQVYEEFGEAPNNTFSWQGLSCTLMPREEKLGEKSGPHSNFTNWNIVIVADITDRLKKTETLRFYNNIHSGEGFTHLFNYLNDLHAFDTHRAIREHEFRINQFI